MKKVFSTVGKHIYSSFYIIHIYVCRWSSNTVCWFIDMVTKLILYGFYPKWLLIRFEDFVWHYLERGSLKSEIFSHISGQENWLRRIWTKIDNINISKSSNWIQKNVSRCHFCPVLQYNIVLYLIFYFLF